MGRRRHSRVGVERMARWSSASAAMMVFLLGAAVQSMTLEVLDGREACVIINAKKGNTINGNFEVLTPGRSDKVMVVLKGVEEDYFRANAPEDGEYEMCFLNGATETMQKLSNKPLDTSAKLVGLDAKRAEKKREATKGNTDPADKGASKSPDSSEDKTITSYSSTMQKRIRTDSETSLSDGDDASYDSWYSVDVGYKTFGFGLRLGADGIDLDALSEISAEDKEIAKFLEEEAGILMETLAAFNDHESYNRGREELHRQSVEQVSSRLMWCTFIEALVLVWVSWTQLSYIRRFFETKRIL